MKKIQGITTGKALVGATKAAFMLLLGSYLISSQLILGWI